MSHTLSTSLKFLVKPRQYVRRRCQKAGCRVVNQDRVETPEQAYERRLRESDQVYERIFFVESPAQFREQLDAAGDKLVVLEVQKEDVCETGMMEEPEYHWKLDKQKVLAEQMAACEGIKHRFQRTARECPDTVFLEVKTEEEGGQQLCDDLGIEVIPTLQFYRKGKLLWEHKGALHMEQEIGQGMLFYGDRGGEGLRPSEFVQEITTKAQYDEFTRQTDDKVLNCVLVSLTSAAPCIRVYPAVVALARSFKGYANFARMWGDNNDEMQKLMAEKKILEVPTFLFYRNGEEVHRHVGSSRGDLIGQILEVQTKYGIQPPPTISPGKTRRRRKSQKA
eukprot:TRINITY_DN3134_c0_g1_i1.p1 TRINITY_DN3134_c0_g1~~TRINITY_DN3134_c0_g1_i1.p1  ORF type:complete len:336 (-),score=56.93 TRINITY_DN3134_c0_g1_i1:304-1311(-)